MFVFTFRASFPIAANGSTVRLSMLRTMPSSSSTSFIPFSMLGLLPFTPARHCGAIAIEFEFDIEEQSFELLKAALALVQGFGEIGRVGLRWRRLFEVRGILDSELRQKECFSCRFVSEIPIVRVGDVHECDVVHEILELTQIHIRC
jgi:hypothetical protein